MQVVELLGQRHDLAEVVRVHAHEHAVAAVRVLADDHAGRGQALEQRLLHRLAEAEHLACGLHLRAEVGVDVAELFKREHRHLDRVIWRDGVQAGAIAETFQRCAEHDACRHVHHRHARDLADVRHGARGAGVDLDDVELVFPDEVLDVHKPLRAEREGELARAVDDLLRHHVVEVVWRVDGDGVAAVHAGALDVLHDAGDEHVRTVGDDVHLQLRAHHVFVHEHGVIDALRKDALHVRRDLGVVVDDLHVLAADDVRRAQQHGVAERLRGVQRLGQRLHTHALRARDVKLLEQGIKPLAVLGDVNALGRRAEDADAVAVERLRERDGGLAAEGDHDADGLLHVDDLQHVLGRERLEIQPVGGVVVRGDGLGIVVDDDDVIAHGLERPHAVDGRIVKLDALADADRPGAEHHDDGLAAAREGARLAARVRAGVEIRRLRVELGGAGVDHLVARAEGGQRLAAGQAAQRRVRIAEVLAALVKLRRQAALDARLVVHKVLQPGQKPAVDAGDVVDLIDGHAAAQRLKDGEQAVIVAVGEPVAHRAVGQGLGVQRVEMDLGAAHGLEQRAFKVRADGHDLAGGLHLRAEAAGRADELVKRPLGELHDDVVQRGLKAGAGLAGDVILNFIERVAEGDLRRDLCDRVAGRLRRERRRARHAGVDLDDGVLKAVGVERELAVAAADDVERGDDVQRRAAQHLKLLVRERQRRGDDDAVAGVYADGVEVFHAAHGDDVAGTVAHGLKLDLFPAVDIALDEDLRDRGRVEAGLRGARELLRAVGHAAPRAAERERRADDNGVADAARDLQRLGHGVRNAGGDGRLADGGHGLLKKLAVLGLVDGFGVRADEADVVLLQKALLVELHRERQARLAAETGEETVGLFLFNNALDGGQRERLEINFVREGLVGHDGRGVGVDEHDVHARVVQHAARLRAGIVKLRRLTDHDRAGADDHDFADAGINRHGAHLPSGHRIGQRERPCRAGPSTPRGETARKRPAGRGSRCPRTCRRWR